MGLSYWAGFAMSFVACFLFTYRKAAKPRPLHVRFLTSLLLALFWPFGFAYIILTFVFELL